MVDIDRARAACDDGNWHVKVATAVVAAPGEDARSARAVQSADHKSDALRRKRHRQIRTGHMGSWKGKHTVVLPTGAAVEGDKGGWSSVRHVVEDLSHGEEIARILRVHGQMRL